MDKTIYKIIMERANGKLMTALENQIQADIGGSRKQANVVANHLLDILDAHQEYGDNNEWIDVNKKLPPFNTLVKVKLTNDVETLDFVNTPFDYEMPFQHYHVKSWKMPSTNDLNDFMYKANSKKNPKENKNAIKINSINMKEVTDDCTYYRMYVDADTLPEWMYDLAKVIDEDYGYLSSREDQIFELEGYISDDGKVNELSLVYYFDDYITITDIDNEDDEDCNRIFKAFEEFASKYGNSLPDNSELSLGDCEYIERIPQDLKDEWGL